MDKSNTNIYRQYIDASGKEEPEMRYKVVSVQRDDLYISFMYPERDLVESRYDPKFNGWAHAIEIDESDLPVEHLEKLEDIRERLSRNEDDSSRVNLGKAKL